jgi:hypothetical protein
MSSFFCGSTLVTLVWQLRTSSQTVSPEAVHHQVTTFISGHLWLVVAIFDFWPQKTISTRHMSIFHDGLF